MGRVAEFDADVKRVTRTLEAWGEDSLRATPRPNGCLGRVQLIWCRRNIPFFEELHNKSIAVGREPEIDDDA